MGFFGDECTRGGRRTRNSHREVLRSDEIAAAHAVLRRMATCLL